MGGSTSKQGQGQGQGQALVPEGQPGLGPVTPEVQEQPVPGQGTVRTGGRRRGKSGKRVKKSKSTSSRKKSKGKNRGGNKGKKNKSRSRSKSR